MTVEQIKTELDNTIKQLRIIVENQEKTLEILLPPSPEENLVKLPVEIESPSGLLVEIQQKLEKINRLVNNIKTKHSYLQDCVFEKKVESSINALHPLMSNKYDLSGRIGTNE